LSSTVYQRRQRQAIIASGHASGPGNKKPQIPVHQPDVVTGAAQRGVQRIAQLFMSDNLNGVF
jgi:hypothetical protein